MVCLSHFHLAVSRKNFFMYNLCPGPSSMTVGPICHSQHGPKLPPIVPDLPVSSPQLDTTPLYLIQPPRMLRNLS